VNDCPRSAACRELVKDQIQQHSKSNIGLHPSLPTTTVPAFHNTGKTIHRLNDTCYSWMKRKEHAGGARQSCSNQDGRNSFNTVGTSNLFLYGATKPSLKTSLLFGGLVTLIFPQISWLTQLSTSSLQIDQQPFLETVPIADQNGTAGACSGYDGVLHIAQGDGEGAAGTIFFLFVVNQLIYADMYNLLPWVHLNNVSKYVYDNNIHGRGNTKTFPMMCGKTVSWDVFTDPITNNQHRYPGKPQVATDLAPCQVSISGNGVWNSYFEPVSSFSPNDPSCTSLPLIRMTHSQIIPSLHVFAPWSVRAWRYGGVPPSLGKHNETYQEWFAPMRQRGHAMVQKYIRFLPYLQERASQQNPSSQCLALHIRHSDKANRRKRIPVQRFLPYVKAYYQHQMQQNQPQFSIYLATDSSRVIDLIQNTWPQSIQSVLHWQKGNVIRSNDTTAVFQMNHATHHHETNVQVLTDIWAMSQCQHLLHGLSAVSEAVHYLNPSLHHRRSVNLDDRKKDVVTVEQFQEMLLEA
jgi:hypothetical protein